MNYAIITVDTEGHDGVNPIEKLIWGKLSDDSYAGIDLIMDITDNYGIKALFFVDMAEAWDYGKENIKIIINHIRARGHVVGVHIHPDHMADKSRLFLWEYSKEEQLTIIKKCTELYKEITNESPKYFRAGKYSANFDTLDIINDLGYKYDFSQFMGQKWCGLKPALTADKPCRYKNLIEFPVSVFKSAETPIFKRYDKLDIEMVSSQYNYVIHKFSKINNNVIILFAHSFSFIKWRRNPDRPLLWKKNIRKFKSAILKVRKNKNINIISPDELEKLTTEGGLDISVEGNLEPQIKVKNYILAYYFLLTTSIRILSYNKKAKIFFGLNMLIAIIIFSFVIIKLY